jgi:hypothetical protein
LVGILYCKNTKSGISISGFHQNIKDFQNKKFLLLSKKFSKNVVDFSAFVLSKWINIWLYFYTARIQTQY